MAEKNDCIPAGEILLKVSSKITAVPAAQALLDIYPYLKNGHRKTFIMTTKITKKLCWALTLWKLTLILRKSLADIRSRPRVCT